MRELSTLETICYLAALLSMILCVGTFGAIETGGLTLMPGMVRCGVFLAISGAAVFVGRRYA